MSHMYTMEYDHIYPPQLLPSDSSPLFSQHVPLDFMYSPTFPFLFLILHQVQLVLVICAQVWDPC